MRLENKVGIVTGAGSGIGRASAELFAREGAAVVVADNREHKAAQTIEAILAAGGRAVASVTDVTQAAEVEAMVTLAESEFGGLDILYNNAGTIRPGSATDLAEADWDIVMDTNVRAVFLGAKFAVPAMRRRGGGAIVTTASISGMRADTNNIAYGAAKAAAINLTRCLAVDHAADNIRVNCVCPGVVATPPIRWLFSDPADQAAAAAASPMNRMCEPEEIADTALYLASNDASFITGQAIVVDGGMIVKSPVPEPGGPPKG